MTSSPLSELKVEAYCEPNACINFSHCAEMIHNFTYKTQNETLHFAIPFSIFRLQPPVSIQLNPNLSRNSHNKFRAKHIKLKPETPNLQFTSPFTLPNFQERLTRLTLNYNSFSLVTGNRKTKIPHRI